MSQKPRVAYADFVKSILPTFKPRTIAWLIQRVIEDVQASPTTIAQFGKSVSFTLARLQREPIGQVAISEFAKHHVIDHCKLRRQGTASRKGVCPATVKGDITALRGVINHAMYAFADCEKLTLAPFEDSKKFLVKHRLIGKSTPRTRRPVGDEIPRLLDDLAVSDAHPNTQIKMVPVVAFGLVSSRRRGEVVRITHGDIDYEKKVYWVRDVKHPTRKKGNDKCLVLWPELEQIIKMQPRLRPDDPTERIFPYNGESVGKRYIDAKKRLGIKDLRLHDNRREAISRWLLKLGSKDKVMKLVSAHDSDKVFDTVYDGRTTAEIMQADALVQQFLQKEPERPAA